MLRLLGTRPPDGAERVSLCADLSDAQTEEVLQTIEPDARRLFTDPVRWPMPTIRSWYVVLAEDRDVPPVLQREMAARIGAERTVELPSGHLPMISRPDELARVVAGFIEGGRASLDPGG